MRDNRQRTLLTGSLLLLFLLLCVANFAFGTVSIPWRETFKSLFNSPDANTIYSNILLKTRLPQTITAASAGLALGISGLMMQTLFRNPLAGPSILGISSGASLGVALVVLVGGSLFNAIFSSYGLWGDMAIIVAAFLGAFSILFLVLFIARKVKGSLGLLLIGIMVGYLANSLTNMFKYYSFEEDVHAYVVWGLGSFGRLSLSRALIMSGFTVIPSLMVFTLAKPLNLLSMGVNYAQSLGLNVSRTRWLIILASGFLTASVTAFCGPIAFIGLAVPHMARMLLRTSNHLALIGMSGLCGATTALLCNLIARLPGFDGTLPINAVTAFIGAPIVISILLRKQRDQISE